MTHLDTARFGDVPWCVSLLSAPNIVTFEPASHAKKANGSASQDELFARTLKTDEAIPRCLGFYQAPTTTSDTAVTGLPFLLSSCTLLFDLRSGVNGFNGTAHGGLIVALMDEAMGSYLYINDLFHRERKAAGTLSPNSSGFENLGFLTGRIDTKLLKPIYTPQIVIVTSRLAGVDGRKVHLQVVVKGRNGEEYATCDGTWISFILNKL
ncbi:hypothetical protein E8E14_011208 [Neopestalotiopsis sp. 37M]|nr:hypothetical protein E8E14_011208 [Neopestalotiopsis sp. 37M]